MSEEAIKRALKHAEKGLRAREEFFRDQSATLVEAAGIVAARLARGGKLLVCGNGGSAADAQHIAAEFVNRYKLERPPLPAVALTTDSSALTAIGNDYGFDLVFAKQVQALGRPGDALLAISTSGNSPNVLHALSAARQKDLVIIGMTGRGGGEMAHVCDLTLKVPSKDTPVVQEVHIAAAHILCELVDYFLFEAVSELEPYFA